MIIGKMVISWVKLNWWESCVFYGWMVLVLCIKD